MLTLPSYDVASLEPHGNIGTQQVHRPPQPNDCAELAQTGRSAFLLLGPFLVEVEGSALQRVEAENQGQAVKDLANPRRCELAHPLGQPIPIHGSELRDVDDAGAG
jgi:hypothetical protein